MLAGGGCGGGPPSPPPVPAATVTATATATAAAPTTARPAALRELCGPLHARVTGRVRAAAAVELSGLVLSRTQPGVLWTHNDSGDGARILAVTRAGRLLSDVTVTGAQAVDWEDIAIAGRTLYIADTGDNDEQRESVDVYRVAEPRLPATATAPATRLTLRYDDGPHDAEALLVDPGSGALVVVTKSFGGEAGIYVAARPSTTLRRAGALSLGTGEPVTAASLSADGRTIAVRTYDSAFAWHRRPGQPVAAALQGARCSADVGLLSEGQGEAIALARDGRSFYTVPEGGSPRIRQYRSRSR